MQLQCYAIDEYFNKKITKCYINTVRPLLSAVLGRTKFWYQKPRINEVCR